MTSGVFYIENAPINLSVTTKQTIAGIYSAISTAYELQKPTVIEGCTMGTANLSPISVTIRPGTGTNYIIRSGVFDITVDNADGVTVTNLIPSTPSGS